MFEVKKTQADVAGRINSFETGRVARQAGGSVLAQVGDVVVHVAATAAKQPLQGVDFMPLTVHYQEKTYAAGRFLGGFFKREGRPSEKETLTSRLIDRPIRPLFPKGYFHETQVIATVMSVDEDTNPDIVAINGVSAALAISDVPFAEPIAASRVGLIDGEFILNPTYAQIAVSDLDLIVAGTRDAVLMIESEAKELSEAQMIDAITFGQAGYQPVLDAIEELVKLAGKEKLVVALAGNADVQDAVNAAFEADVRAAYAIVDKSARAAKIDAFRAAAQESLAGTADAPGQFSANDVSSAMKSLEKKVVRRSIIAGNPRIDGRATNQVRAIDCQVGILPRTHGSALFTRGETQALVTITLGTESDMQMTESLEGVAKQRFMLHYNFPPYSVGEARRFGPPGRREIGHGRLARRGVEAVLPSMEKFGYAIRSVSEITESNGSSSMASVCGTSLALMDAGVPVKAAVAGVAMGLILETDGYAVLTDILGDEDHLGDMDFKVAGTRDGVTTLQLDIKIGGLTREIMQEALAQAHAGRIHILDEMAKCMETPRGAIADHAPRMFTMKIKTDKIREVIGAGGKVIRGIVEDTGAKVDIEDDGSIKIFAVTAAAGEAARKMIEDIVAEVEVGAIYVGKVVKLMDFGAFVRVVGGTDGLVHISQIANHRVEKVADELKEGQEVRVKVLEVDRQGKIRLSMKDVLNEETKA
ncbi:MAG: polyribonucleotide nucleotidyltransferase [Zetaproteobacteria bacterium CG12_big_fil_rev_8_21_14_0_65_54_13]|nr:MAG: polyribonucleotide nucleotidyltransferase [Zetaproteobacteria bacterium CG12_big_fil_rev_8_21_14_0_65_54_13]PIX55473.1 MAG: polyribonucleotide nucleotidyltransferase [Zetaproteobacteria bacterium CG_4_10_14_3_um_filter_54_28]PJA29209.1 MAG: polyribonucleotide nucleotidyltransferase [Zetaproteobacteria bacterium CG_4_9_14_3_um_filter_54_145]